MKILHLIDSGGMYGAEVILLHLANEQRKRGIEPILGSIGKLGIYEKGIEIAAQKNGIEVKKFRMRNGPNIFGAFSILKFAQENMVDIIHCHGYKANIIISMIPSFLRKIPCLTTLHGWTGIKKFSKMWVYAWAEVLSVKRADASVVVSKAMQDHKWILAVNLRPHLVHNGIPSITIKNGNGEAFEKFDRFCSKHFIVGAIGRLSLEKGFDFLIKAVSKVIKSGREVRLVIIGEGGERQKLESIAKSEGIAERVMFAGYLSDASQYFRFFDVFVMSSLTEGLPITLLEAMQAGVPVIATKVGGIPEVLDNGRLGMLVSPQNEDELASAIIQLHDSPELREKPLSQAKEYIEREFSSENMERWYRKLYKELTSTKRPNF